MLLGMTSDPPTDHQLYVQQAVLTGRLLAALDELEHHGALALPLANATQDKALEKYQNARRALAAHFDRVASGTEQRPEPSASCAQNSAQQAPAPRGPLNLGPPSS